MTTQTVNTQFQGMAHANLTEKNAGFSINGKMNSVNRLFRAAALAIFCISATGNVCAQEATSAPMVQDAAYANLSTNIFNYTTVYNSGKVFVNWTAKDEPADCIYIVERSSDGRKFESVGVKEGIGTNLELFYSWMDHTPPAGFAYYRVKKITKDGMQMYSSTNTIINQGSSFDKKSNYAKSGEPANELK